MVNISLISEQQNEKVTRRLVSWLNTQGYEAEYVASSDPRQNKQDWPDIVILVLGSTKRQFANDPENEELGTLSLILNAVSEDQVNSMISPPIPWELDLGDREAMILFLRNLDLRKPQISKNSKVQTTAPCA